MAEQGRTTTNVKKSVFEGSTADCCQYDPCNYIGRTVEADGFCVTCQENLCKHCVDAHKGTSACRHHSLLDKPQTKSLTKIATSKDIEIGKDLCKMHSKVVSFFCSLHNKAGCHDCMLIDHNTCPADSIPEISTEVLKSKEYDETIQKISLTIKVAEMFDNKARSQKADKKTVEGAIIEIENYQEKLNSKIEQLKQQLVKEVNSLKEIQNQNVDKILESSAKVASELTQARSLLQDYRTKTLHVQAFVTMKQAQMYMNNSVIQNLESDLIEQTKILFEPNKRLEYKYKLLFWLRESFHTNNENRGESNQALL